MSKKMVSIILAIIAFISFLLFRVDSLSTQLEQVKTSNKSLSSELKKSNEKISFLTETQQQNDADLRKYYQQLADVKHINAEKDKELERLKHENQILSDWANTQLPGDIIRLHNRPAFSSAADYYKYLSGGDSLPNSSH